MEDLPRHFLCEVETGNLSFVEKTTPGPHSLLEKAEVNPGGSSQKALEQRCATFWLLWATSEELFWALQAVWGRRVGVPDGTTRPAPGKSRSSHPAFPPERAQRIFGTGAGPLCVPARAVRGSDRAHHCGGARLTSRRGPEGRGT